MEPQKKIVDFKLCVHCKHYNEPQEEDPCNTCLTQNYNDNSHYPVAYDGPRPERVKRRHED